MNMLSLYYYVVLINAVVSLGVAAAVFWRNRYQAVGPVLGLTMVIMAVWLFGLAHYFRPMGVARELMWARVTLTASVIINPMFFHAMCALIRNQRRYKWWLAAAYATGAAFVLLVWSSPLIRGIKPSAIMDHYIHYDRNLYPALGLHIVFWQVFGAGLLAYSAHKATGYKRTQLVYFTVAWGIVFLTTSAIMLPLEYGFNVPPFGFLILPINFAFLAYVMAKARMADYNVVIARVLLHALTVLIVIVLSLLTTAVMAVVAPGFMKPQQVLFMVVQVTAIGLALAVTLPGWLPRAERIISERLFAGRYSYQDALAGMVKELSVLPTIDQVLNTAATTLHSQMQISRALILMQDMVSGGFKLLAESGLGPEDDTETLALKEDTAIVKWLGNNKDALVRQEMARRVAPWLQQHLETELNRLGVSVCVPMIVDGRLVGIICLGEKLSRDMFFVSDLRLLESLASEVALAVKYRRMEDEVFRKNRLIELGTIAAGVAHEIRNPLASIKTFAQLMPERMDDPEFKNEFSKLVLKDVDRITKVVESMLAFARPAQVNIKEQPTNDLVEEAILLVQPRLKAKRLELTRAFHGNPIVKVDKHQILQVLVNLLSNAADALHEQGKIRVATGVSQLDLAGGGNGNRSFAVIEVSDNGPGISPSVRNRLFDPFFTTKKEGTGLGLSISQKIVRDHGGAITVSSVEGKGTTFQVNLPLT
jgi:signal transduction histidine kinase